MSGVCATSGSAAFTCAPRSSSSRTASTLSARTAAISSVSPAASAVFTSARASSSRREHRGVAVLRGHVDGVHAERVARRPRARRRESARRPWRGRRRAPPSAAPSRRRGRCALTSWPCFTRARTAAMSPPAAARTSGSSAAAANDGSRRRTRASRIIRSTLDFRSARPIAVRKFTSKDQGDPRHFFALSRRILPPMPSVIT